MNKPRAAAVAFFLSGTTAIALAACGGASDSGLFGNGSTISGSTPDGAAPLPGPGSEDATTGNPGNPGNPGKPDGATGPADAARADAKPVPADAIADQTPPPVDPGVKCGTESCKVPGDLCCRSGTAGVETFACVASGAGNCMLPGDLPVPCDDPKDCTALGRPGSVCCAQETVDPVSQTLTVTSVTCRSPGACNGNGRKIVCDLEPGGCPAGTACATTPTFPGFNLCQ